MDAVPVPLAAAYVALGGACGSVARYLVGVAVGAWGRPAWAATLAVNLVGAFAMGLLLGGAPPRRTVLLLGTGVLGGFTTFSTFAADTSGLLGPALDWRGAAYAGGTVVLGILAFTAGRAASAAL